MTAKYVPWFLVFLIFVLGLYMRCESVDGTPVIDPIRADAANYFMYGYNLRNLHTYSLDPASLTESRTSVPPDAIRPPGYPLFLALFLKAPLDDSVLYRISLIQAFMSALCVILVFYFSKIFLPVGWALGASFLTAVSPHLIVGNSYLLTESLFSLFVIFFLLLISIARRSPWIAGAAGFVLGLTTLVRSGLQFFPLALVFLFLPTERQKGLRLLLGVVLGFALAFSPWAMRNLVVLGKTSDDKLAINFLHHGMYPDFTFEHKAESFGFPYKFDPRSDEIAKNTGSVLKEIGRRFSEEPLPHLRWYLMGKPVAFWSWNTVQGVGDAFIYQVQDSPYLHNPLFRWTHRLMYLLHWPLVCLALLSSILVWLPGRPEWLSGEKLFAARAGSLLLLYFTALHMVGAPFPRYSFPLRPELYSMGLLMLHILLQGVFELFRSKSPRHSQS